jgi:hypothetical protein
MQLLSSLMLISTLIALAGTDLEHQLLPDDIVGPAALVGLELQVLGNPEWWRVYLVSALVVAETLFALAVAYPHKMGMGEVKMGGRLGACLGPYAALAVFSVLCPERSQAICSWPPGGCDAGALCLSASFWRSAASWPCSLAPSSWVSPSDTFL